jgi:hypothetical protein
VSDCFKLCTNATSSRSLENEPGGVAELLASIVDPAAPILKGPDFLMPDNFTVKMPKIPVKRVAPNSFHHSGLPLNPHPRLVAPHLPDSERRALWALMQAQENHPRRVRLKNTHIADLIECRDGLPPSRQAVWKLKKEMKRRGTFN